MNIHEYQAKLLFRDYGIPVPDGTAITSPHDLPSVLSTLGGNAWMVKAQVHAGGRGKAGGVKYAASEQAAASSVKQLLGSRLVTHQTDASGQPVSAVLIEATCNIARELYLGMVVDRGCRRIAIMASTEGGMDIEEVAASAPDKIITVFVDPVVGLQPYQCRQIAFGLALEGAQIREMGNILQALYRLFNEKDASLLEINPLVVTGPGELVALDAKINFDNNAGWRHQDILELRDTSQEDERECKAQEFGLNYISLDGDIACMVNGAGLAMTTMDMTKLFGGSPANFLDIALSAVPWAGLCSRNPIRSGRERDTGS